VLTDGQLLVEQVRNSERTPLVAALLHGPAGAGKTALAAKIATDSNFPFIKLISPEQMVGFSESQKIAQMTKIFSDSYKSPLSVVVVDSIERLLDWNPIGPRFSNSVLQALVVLFGKRPPKGRRLLVLATTSDRTILTDMGVLSAFDSTIYVPPIDNIASIGAVVSHLELFAGDQRAQDRALTRIRDMYAQGNGDADAIRIGIKKLLTFVEMARQDRDGDPAEKLVSVIYDWSLSILRDEKR
jgi:vesicle-fusing ATPase